MIKGKESTTNYYQQIVTDDEYFQAQQARLLENIGELVDQLAKLQSIHAHGDFYLAKLDGEIKQLNKQLLLCKYTSQMERLLRMEEKANALQTEEV